MKKALFLILIFVSLIILILRFGSPYLVEFLKLQPRVGIRIEANPKARVVLEGKDLGETPFQDENLTAGEYLIKLESDSGSWQGYVKLTGGTLSVINRDLAQTPASSSGEIITLEKGNGATIISTPQGADVEVDGKPVGKTPLLLTSLAEGEHLFLISHNNFLKRNIRALVVKDYNLNINIDLAISEADFTQITTSPIQVSKEVVVKVTPTGFLRVRAGPNISSSEIARVAPGDILTLIEELSSWMKVRLPNGKEGYVSVSFVEKHN